MSSTIKKKYIYTWEKGEIEKRKKSRRTENISERISSASGVDSLCRQLFFFASYSSHLGVDGVCICVHLCASLFVQLDPFT